MVCPNTCVPVGLTWADGPSRAFRQDLARPRAACWEGPGIQFCAVAHGADVLGSLSSGQRHGRVRGLWAPPRAPAGEGGTDGTMGTLQRRPRPPDVDVQRRTGRIKLQDAWALVPSRGASRAPGGCWRVNTDAAGARAELPRPGAPGVGRGSGPAWIVEHGDLVGPAG